MNTITIKNQTLSYLGDASMLLCPLTTFLCSHRVPEGVSNVIRQWVEGLDTANTCVVCGNLTGEERYVRRLLVERGIPVVLALANAIPENLAELRLNSPELEALNTGHMVVISPIVDATIKDASGKTSAARVLQNDGQNEVREPDAKKAQDNAHRMGWAIYRRLKEGRLVAPTGSETSEISDEATGTSEDAPLDAAAGSSTEDLMPWEVAPHSTSDSSQTDPVSSLEMRQLLAQYLKMNDIEKPSLLHSLVLFQVVKYYSHFPDFNFTAFFRLWGPENLRQEDWKATKVNEVWLPSLADRVMSRLFKALPSRFHEPVNADERFDSQLAHTLLDEALQRARKPNKRLYQRALNLAYFERDSEAISRFRELLGKDAK